MSADTTSAAKELLREHAPGPARTIALNEARKKEACALADAAAALFATYGFKARQLREDQYSYMTQREDAGFLLRVSYAGEFQAMDLDRDGDACGQRRPLPTGLRFDAVEGRFYGPRLLVGGEPVRDTVNPPHAMLRMDPLEELCRAILAELQRLEARDAPG